MYGLMNQSTWVGGFEEKMDGSKKKRKVKKEIEKEEEGEKETKNIRRKK